MSHPRRFLAVAAVVVVLFVIYTIAFANFMGTFKP